jgi:hypothetical protein
MIVKLDGEFRVFWTGNCCKVRYRGKDFSVRRDHYRLIDASGVFIETKAYFTTSREGVFNFDNNPACEMRVVNKGLTDVSCWFEDKIIPDKLSRDLQATEKWGSSEVTVFTRGSLWGIMSKRR